LTERAIRFIAKLLVVDARFRLGHPLLGGSQGIFMDDYFSEIDWEVAKERRLPPPFLPALERERIERFFSSVERCSF